MTDSIKTSISLAKLAERARMDIPANICSVSDPWGQLKERYTKPSCQPSGIAGTGTQWVVRCASGSGELAGYPVPSRIDAELNIPNAIVGHNVEHGTSVFAAGVAALELQRIWMAKQGLPRDQLDLLTTADVKLNGATITYLFPFATREEAEKLVEATYVTGRVLNPKGCKKWESANATVMLPGRGFTVGVYIKTDLSHCVWAAGAPVNAMVDRASHIVRIEAKLGGPFLRKRDLGRLERWRTAYERGEYETIFNDTVRKVLRLDKKRLRHKAPRDEVFKQLTDAEASLLHHYLRGGDPWMFKSIAESSRPANRYYGLRKRILDVAHIDIGIPWKGHIKLRCFELWDQLRYPGDYHPTEVHAPWCFCEANWPNLQQKMRETYEAALEAALAKAAPPAGHGSW